MDAFMFCAGCRVKLSEGPKPVWSCYNRECRMAMCGACAKNMTDKINTEPAWATVISDKLRRNDDELSGTTFVLCPDCFLMCKLATWTNK